MFISKETKLSRLNICLKCEYIKYIALNNIAICSICKCVIKSKIIMQNTSCPKGKW